MRFRGVVGLLVICHFFTFSVSAEILQPALLYHPLRAALGAANSFPQASRNRPFQTPAFLKIQASRN